MRIKLLDAICTSERLILYPLLYGTCNNSVALRLASGPRSYFAIWFCVACSASFWMVPLSIPASQTKIANERTSKIVPGYELG